MRDPKTTGPAPAHVGPMLSFRPHHFLCTLCYRGEGYSLGFQERFSELAARLRDSDAGEEILIEVTEGPDSICGFCPKLCGLRCETQDKVERLDAAHALILGVEAGDRFTWGEAVARLRERMSVEAFEEACASCGWKPMGICRGILRELIEKTSD